jgi:7-dehydrocholesterol reductase
MSIDIFNRKNLRKLLIPLLLMLFTPPLVIIVAYTNLQLNGSLTALFDFFYQKGLFKGLYELWSPYFFGSKIAWSFIAIFSFLQLFLMRFLPGKTYKGPISPAGNVPEYKNNGLSAFLITVALFFIGSYGLNLFSAGILYDEFCYLISALNIFSLLFCLMLYFKGKYKPSSSDCGSNGNIFFDYFWGRELYPRIFGFDVKMFTNCRFGMMAWPILILSFAAKQHEMGHLSNAMIISVVLQLIYITKFFIWESGYMSSMDIMHDRAGYYLCWGCLVWVPGIYTSASLYLVNYPHDFSIFTASLIFLLGVFCIFANYFADLQRQNVRKTSGECTVWGKKPTVIEASYKTLEGKENKNILLVSGYWGLARHIHYVFEILAAFFWTVPAQFNSILPYFYFFFLTALLLDRAFRQERRCQAKYGLYWDQYCQKVPYKLIPYVF